MSCTIYIVNYNFATHATCSLEFMSYKYNELQMSVATQKLSCKASCKKHPYSSLWVWLIITWVDFGILFKILKGII
jgi:hypothetical protein